MSGKRILVVDDDPDLRCIIRDRLKYRGYSVETVGNGHEAVNTLNDADFDGVLLDVTMPGLDGLTVLHHIRQRRPFLPVVMMTGDTSREVAWRVLAAGAQACLLKPFDEGKLDREVQCWFGTAT